MTPNQMQAQAQAMLDLYAQAEELMLGRVAKRLARGVDGGGWAEQKLREAAQMRTVIAGELRRLNDQSQAMREEMLGAAYESGAAAFEGEYAARVTTGGPVGERTPQGRLNAVARVVEELDAKFTALHSAVLRDVDDSYRRIIGNAVAMQATGAITTREAVKQALNQFADRGITGFTDKAGRRWNMDSYAEMAVRTGIMRAAVQGYTDDAVDHGEDLVIVSDHMDTCPLCADWERSVLSLTGAMANHPECDATMSEAVAAGLFHPNCLHSVTVYVPGLTDKAGMKERAGYTREQDAEGYGNRQQQRYMERCARQWKRRQAVATTPEDERLAKAYVDKWQRKLRALTGDKGLPRQYRREGGRQKLSDAAKKLKPLKVLQDGKVVQSIVAVWEDHKPPNPQYEPFAMVLRDTGKGTKSLYIYDRYGKIDIRVDSSHHGYPKDHEFIDSGGNPTYAHYHKAKWRDGKYRGNTAPDGLTKTMEETYLPYFDDLE